MSWCIVHKVIPEMPIALKLVFREFGCEKAIEVVVARSNLAASSDKTRLFKRVLSFS
ncbi:hypothetical protein IQ270_08615 [Microcoleus sp. LEGE 07076]|uniref:hypothetical protein n=1 Tax=Microcoleus sp. LEGE 07076 TaxID=915322 RepID=UPI00187F7253|nr:hypothetical protein [Microcoleus sp. LEGE 07076]MBE9184770.1 hypothetical protein [Microcoleus sp. LEGE 07076]